MPLKPDVLQALDFPEVVQSYSADDSIRYALSIGIGLDPVDPAQLRYVYEKDLKAFPTMAAVLGCTPRPWSTMPETGVTRTKLVHGEQRIVFHAPFPPEGEVRSKDRIAGVYDKGAEKGAIVATERQVFDAKTGTLLATLQAKIFCRADGGFGGGNVPAEPVRAFPDTPPTHVIELPTFIQQALLYRLNYDRNPLHVDPEVAKIGGFPRPILHGLATWAVAAYGIVRDVLGGDADRLREFEVRFSQPVLPGETVTLEAWVQGEDVLFRGFVRERDAKVLDRGYARIAA
ncbi:MaoC/PaaZ C-terminal domain-containing protein [Ramlibacter sp.]|uniref:MaoC/PaaZ C-terminal domain-containing protein n=1 Tax=Ramlibacter sp. TaxID=1917967 RepID=UPI003D0CA636